MEDVTKNFRTVWWNRLLILLLVAVVAYYGVIHWRVIWLSEPATARETAVVADVVAFANPSGPRPYSLESLPGNTNVYGPGFLWSSLPFVRLVSLDAAVVLRMENALLLAVLLGLLGYGGRKASWMVRLFSLVLVYALFVSSPSVAASPDILACVLYMIAWIVAVEGNFCAAASAVSILAGLLALLSKPYLVLVVPAIGSYLFLFRSPRAGIWYALAALIVFGTALWVANVYYPYYFYSVFAIHLSAANRNPMVAFNQWKEMLYLAPVPCIFAIIVGYRWVRCHFGSLQMRIQWRKPIFGFERVVDPYAWGAVVAVAALAVSLSWHDGAHLIYFWHLLLPLLVLIQMRQPAIHTGWLGINALILLLLRPPLPDVGEPAEWRALRQIVETHPRVYLDPYLRALKPGELGHADRDNAQSEYLLGLTIAGKTQKTPAEDSDYGYTVARRMALNHSPILGRAEAFLRAQQRGFREQSYDVILLTNGLFFYEYLLPTIKARYRITGTYELHPYYLAFRDRWAFGHAPVLILKFEPIKNNTPR